MYSEIILWVLWHVVRKNESVKHSRAKEHSYFEVKIICASYYQHYHTINVEPLFVRWVLLLLARQHPSSAQIQRYSTHRDITLV